jgi:hypothetical protein
MHEVRSNEVQMNAMAHEGLDEMSLYPFLELRKFLGFFIPRNVLGCHGSFL